MRILVVDDEPKIVESLREGLELEGYNVDSSLSGEDAFFLMSNHQYDLVLLDWMLPGRSGIEILNTIRKKGTETPILLLTAKDTVDDKIQGLDSGADDYITKPFDFLELKARIRSLLRRDQYRKNQTILNLDGLEINCNQRTVLRYENDFKMNVDLTNKEFELLSYLCKYRKETVSREMISKQVWKIESRVTSMNSIIDVHINRLRKKIDDPFKKKVIKTVRGIGFRIDA